MLPVPPAEAVATTTYAVARADRRIDSEHRQTHQRRGGSTEALAAEEVGWTELHSVIDRLTPEQALQPGYYREGWSAKDLLAHIGVWLAEAGTMLERINGRLLPARGPRCRRTESVVARRHAPHRVPDGEGAGVGCPDPDASRGARAQRTFPGSALVDRQGRCRNTMGNTSPGSESGSRSFADDVGDTSSRSDRVLPTASARQPVDCATSSQPATDTGGSGMSETPRDAGGYSRRDFFRRSSGAAVIVGGLPGDPRRMHQGRRVDPEPGREWFGIRRGHDRNAPRRLVLRARHAEPADLVLDRGERGPAARLRQAQRLRRRPQHRSRAWRSRRRPRPTARPVTYALRSGVTWHDGKPFTADDVEFTFELIGDKDSRSTRSG